MSQHSKTIFVSYTVSLLHVCVLWGGGTYARPSHEGFIMWALFSVVATEERLESPKWAFPSCNQEGTHFTLVALSLANHMTLLTSKGSRKCGKHCHLCDFHNYGLIWLGS